MNQLARIVIEFFKIADYDEEAQRAYRRLRGGSQMDNRMNAAERFIDERQYEAMKVVARARLQQEAERAAGEANGRAGGLVWLAQALRRALHHSLRSHSRQALQGDAARTVPARVEIRRF